MKLHMLATCATILALGTSDAIAQSRPTPGVQSFELLSGWRDDNGQHMAAVRIQLDAGWKTYWRAPGNFGIPASFDWSGSQNIAEVRFHWPTPQIYHEAGVTSIGYKDELVLPVEFTPKIKGKDIVVSADVEFGVCSDVCLPAASRIDAVLTNTNMAHVPTIQASLANRPENSHSAGVRNVTCAITPDNDGFQLTATLRTAKPLTDQAMAVVEYANDNIWLDDTKTRSQGRETRLTTTLYSTTGTPVILDRSKLRLTLFDRAQAIDIQGCPAG